MRDRCKFRIQPDPATSSLTRDFHCRRSSLSLFFHAPDIAPSGSTQGEASRQHIRRGALFDHGPFHLEEQPDHQALDLVKMRRQLTALRSQHSDNLRIATLLNRLLVKIAFLTEPKDLANAKYLRSEIEKTFAKVKEISARTKSD
ncbi:hypothetical protein ACVWWG_000014 [Bradyrhizobium sp. LB7.2]